VKVLGYSRQVRHRYVLEETRGGRVKH
jgi:hypothetical protein